MHIMGILNVTPDSFSDGGKWAGTDAALAHGAEMIAQGATIIDVGGESTRPGSTPVSPEDEWERIGVVVEELAKKVTVSVDTYHAETAKRAVAAGAHIINDVTGGRVDPDMFPTVAGLDCDYILQHSRGVAQTTDSEAIYDDVAEDVRVEMLQARDRAVAAGIAAERIILDPGLGFSKIGDQDWRILAATDKYLNLGHRLLIGQSRKRFLAPTLPEGKPAIDRDTATAVISGLLSETDVWAVRVHNVLASASAVRTHELLRKVQG